MPNLNTELLSKIDTAVDAMVSMLKKQLVSGQGFQKRGLWDRFKNFLSNTWYGRYSQKNPYYFINTLGDFAGSSSPKKIEKNESRNKLMSVKNYLEIKSLFDKLEEELSTINENENNAENLRIMRIIDDWARNLKIALKNVFSDAIKIRDLEEKKQKKMVEPKDLQQCRTDLEKKHKEGKISPKDYFVLRAMIDRGDLAGACTALEAVLKKSDEIKNTNEPDEPEESPEKQDQKDVETPTSSEPEMTEEEKNFPFSIENTTEGFKKIRDALRNKTPFKNQFAEWESTASSYQKKKFENLESFLQQSLVGEVDRDEFLNNFKKYKTIVSHILDKSEPPQETKIENTSPLCGLNLREKTKYIKQLISERF